MTSLYRIVAIRAMLSNNTCVLDIVRNGRLCKGKETSYLCG